MPPNRDAGRLPTAILARGLPVLAGLVVFVVAHEVFPYHSVNDDEGVYLLQSAMLLEGQVFLRPHLPVEAVQPWFFVLQESPSGARLLPKYSPVPAAVFALGRLLGDPRYALAFVAAGNAGLVSWLGTAAFDRRTGLLAGGALVASPMFLLTSAVFLPYAPTALLNLGFAAGYVAAARRESYRVAALAGASLGLAVFSRPYTAVLFATPFVVHALYTLARDWTAGRGRATILRYAVLAAPALGGVALSLSYNAVATGDPFVFPYEAFAPRDGLGFGRRALLEYERVYTPALAVETTRRVVGSLLTEWAVAGRVGTALAVVGLAVGFLADDGTSATTDEAASAERDERRRGASDRELRGILAGLFPVVVAGNAYFWGILNGLTNGLFDLLGPYYYFDLLAPLSVFAAAAVVFAWDRLGAAARDRVGARRGRVVLAVLLVTSIPLVGVAEASVLGDPVRANQARTETLATTYEPVREASLDHAVVFTPDTYGDWQAHPFQYLRNDPGFDGDVVYATDGPPARDFAVLDAAADRTPYRLTYRGDWNGALGPVTPRLENLRVVAGDRVDARTTVGVPNGTTAARVRVETDAGYRRYAVPGPVRQGETLTVRWSVGPDAIRARNLDATGGPGAALRPNASSVDLVVTFVDRTGTSLSYRQTVTVERTGRQVRVVWPPETRVCRFTTDCGREGAWVGPRGEYLGGVSVSTTARARNATGAESSARLESTPGRPSSAGSDLSRIRTTPGY
jgi:hypothetical protein